MKRMHCLVALIGFLAIPNLYGSAQLLCLEAYVDPIQSSGSLSFRYNKQFFQADQSHARAYAVSNLEIGYLTAANADNMVLDVQATGLIRTGKLILKNHKADKCILSLNHVEFSIDGEEDYFLINVTEVKREGLMILLSGSFNARLHDKKGNLAVITDGTFRTDHL